MWLLDDSTFFQVNGDDLREASHDRAIQVLRQTPPKVRIIVFRDDSQIKDEEFYDVFTVELLKKPGKGLGLSIVGRRNDVGIFISDIVSYFASVWVNFFFVAFFMFILEVYAFQQL